MLKLLLLAAVITAAASIDCTTWSCTGVDCTPESDGSATTCDAGVEFCLTMDSTESGSELKLSACDGTLSSRLICPSATDGECRVDGEARAMCSKTTPPNGMIPASTSCTTSGQASAPTPTPNPTPYPNPQPNPNPAPYPNPQPTQSPINRRGAPTYPPASTCAESFMMMVGYSGQSCVINCNCVTSPNYPGYYNNNDLCKMITLNAGVVTTTGAFNTESGDRLRLDGVYYEGTTGPVDVSVSAGIILTWETDSGKHGSVTRGTSPGWMICLEPTPPPTGTPTTAATPASTPEAGSTGGYGSGGGGIACTTWSCTGVDCTPESYGSATTCDAGVEFCLTMDITESGSELKASTCDGTLSSLPICTSATDGECRIAGEGRAMCSKTTPPNGMIPASTSCTTSGLAGSAPTPTPNPTPYPNPQPNPNPAPYPNPQPTPEPTPWYNTTPTTPATPEAGSATITQVCTFTSITVKPTGALLNTINYAVALAQGIGEIQSNMFVFFTGCSIKSNWAAARRVGMSATFTSVASAAKATAATTSAGSITAANLKTTMNAIKSGTLAASGVGLPDVGDVAAPSVTVIATAAPSPPTTASAPARTTMSVVAIFGFAAIMKQLF